MNKDELKRNILFVPIYKLIASTVGGLGLYMEVDVFNGHINWLVIECDYETEFDDLDSALDYYEKVGGLDDSQMC